MDNMKIRNGFVSNSSSSSFVLTFQDEEHYKLLISDKEEFKKHFIKRAKQSSPLKAELKMYNEHSSNKFTIDEAVDAIFEFIATAKTNLSYKDLTAVIASGYDNCMNEIIRGKMILWQIKEGMKHGLTQQEIALLYAKDCGLSKETVDDIRERGWKYRKKITKELAEAKAFAIIERNYHPYMIQFEVADENGPMHGFLEHYLIKELFKYTPVHVLQFSHH